jgi:hypothetical protein
MPTPRRVSLFVLSIALAAIGRAPAGAAETRFPGAVTRPGSRGDQVIFFYDARPGFTTFLNLRSTGASALAVQVLFYGPDVGTPFVHAATIPAGPGTAGGAGTGGTVTIDVGALTTTGLPAQAGVAFVTAVDQNGAALVTRVLSGSFTIANLQTGSAWGSTAPTRSAVKVESTTPSTAPCPEKVPAPDRGTIIDGSKVLFPPIQPSAADLAVYYNPDLLAPAALGGNQIVFVTFEDKIGVPFGVKNASTEWDVQAVRDTGDKIERDPYTSNGVTITDLVSLLGNGARGSGGSITFVAEASATRLTRLIFFTETLATFGTGYLLPTR